jgi:hypothetical protein
MSLIVDGYKKEITDFYTDTHIDKNFFLYVKVYNKNLEDMSKDFERYTLECKLKNSHYHRYVNEAFYNKLNTYRSESEPKLLREEIVGDKLICEYSNGRSLTYKSKVRYHCP